MKAASRIETRRLKFAATLNDEALSETTDPDHELKYIDIGNVDSFGRVHEVASYTFSKAPSRARRRVRDGDVIVSTVRTYLQAIAPISEPEDNLVVSTGFAVARPNRDLLDTDFFKYALREPRFLYEVEARSTGISYPAINSTELADIQIHLPPLAEQRRIAAYLDAETAQMDALVAEKEQMLKLLEEKRAAQISHAVTRGLNPRAPLKPSALPWLGDIPKHWEVRRLRWLITDLDQGWSPIANACPAEGDAPAVLKLSAVSKGTFKPSENKSLNDEAPDDLALKLDDVLVTRSNTPQLVGDACLIDKDYPNLFIPDLIYRLRIKSTDAVPSFVVAFLISKVGRRQITADARGSSGSMVKISQEHIKDWTVPVPPLSEQRAIVAHLTAERERTAGLEAALRDSIQLLQERRRALITAAVTGQIAIPELSA